LKLTEICKTIRRISELLYISSYPDILWVLLGTSGQNDRLTILTFKLKIEVSYLIKAWTFHWKSACNTNHINW